MIVTRTRAVRTALVFCLALNAPAHAGVIPLPAKIVPGDGVFEIGAATVVKVQKGDAEAANAARYLVELWQRSNALALPVSVGASASPTPVSGAAAAAADSTIIFRRTQGFGPEAYELKIRPHRISVSATTGAGLFYGAMTLWQLLPPNLSARGIPSQTISDAPRYAWRGLMLDSARHFQSPAFIRSMIDWMAWHKLNVLHWHLTDDQGWRLQIKKYPRLTAIGAWRGDYGGFYTHDEVRDIVAHAATRHVQVVAEIEMPGHAQAAIAAYPALGAGGRPLPVSSNWGVHTHLFNLQPQTFRFLEDVLDEVMQLFPSRYVHVGGDEAVKDEWNASAQVQARMHELGLQNAEALQSYFTQRIGRYLAAHGRRLVGWDEILSPGLPTDAIVMSWRGVAGAHKAAEAGNDTILTPQPTLYFDRRQSTLATEPPGRLELVSLEDVYRFDPSDPSLSAAQRRHVLGVQGDIWTEHIATDKRVEWMALPRAAALAEVGWSAPERRWPDFLARLVPMFARYRAFGLWYADSVFGIDAEIARTAGGITLTLSNAAEFKDSGLGAIRYTLDRSEPTVNSTAYTSPLTLPAGTEVRAATFIAAEQVSRTWQKHLDASAGRLRDSHELDLCSNRIGLLLEPAGAGGSGGAPLAVDIMNPCWIDRGLDLSSGPRIIASVAPLPFNYELGADVASIPVGNTRTPEGELEIHADSCDTAAIATLPLAPAAANNLVTTLPAQRLPPLPGRHDLCLRFARPRLDPMWALNWIEIGE
jgi:hexosaminidase